MIQAIKAKYILTPNQSYIEDSAVIVKDSKIIDIVSSSDLNKSKYKIIDLQKSVLLPGFINAHVHLELYWTQSLLKPFNSFTEWLSQIIDLKKKFNNKKIPISVKKSIKESIDSGVTTIGQISSYNGLDYEPIINSGIRTVYFYELTNSTIGNLDKKFLQKILNKKINTLFHPRIFPHSIYSLDSKSLKKVMNFAKEKDIDLGIHLSESIEEIKYAKGQKNNLEKNILSKLMKQTKLSNNKSTPLEYLDKLNTDKQEIALIHMNNLTKRDLEILKTRNYPVVLCPRSNAYLNQNLPNIKFFSKYEKTGIGTDGLSSNLSINFLDEINFLYLYAKKIVSKNSEKKIIDMATIGGAKALGLDRIVGSIEINKNADLIAFELINKDPFLSIIHSKKNNLKMSMINGKILKLK